MNDEFIEELNDLVNGNGNDKIPQPYKSDKSYITGFIDGSIIYQCKLELILNKYNMRNFISE